MPTPAERKALLFLGLTVALGAAVRFSRAATSSDAIDPDGGHALAAQRAAVDSVAVGARQQGGAAGAKPPSRRAKRRGPVALRHDNPPTRPADGVVARSAAPEVRDPFLHPGLATRAPQPAQAPAPAPAPAPMPRPAPSPPPLVDIDRAADTDMERLPWIGPALARRIVANRDSFGTFGSLDAL